MKIKSVYRRGSKIPESLLGLGYTPRSEFHIPFGTVYIVYGICLVKDVIKYLIIAEETYRPDWFPAIFFEVIDNRLPLDWHYDFWANDPNVVVKVAAVWGYLELCDRGKHYLGLIEREPEALRIFEDRRKEIDDIL